MFSSLTNEFPVGLESPHLLLSPLHRAHPGHCGHTRHTGHCYERSIAFKWPELKSSQTLGQTKVAGSPSLVESLAPTPPGKTFTHKRLTSPYPEELQTADGSWDQKVSFFTAMTPYYRSTTL